MKFKSENEQDIWLKFVIQNLASGIYVIKEAVDKADQLIELYQERSVNLEKELATRISWFDRGNRRG